MTLEEFEAFIKKKPIEDYLVRMRLWNPDYGKWLYFNNVLSFDLEVGKLPIVTWSFEWNEDHHVEILGYIPLREVVVPDNI